jgi:hypothetical protein
LAALRPGRAQPSDLRGWPGLADDREFDAALAIDYAMASVEQAELAVIDAVIARVDAVEAQAPISPTPVTA